MGRLRRTARRNRRDLSRLARRVGARRRARLNDPRSGEVPGDHLAEERVRRQRVHAAFARSGTHHAQHHVTSAADRGGGPAGRQVARAGGRIVGVDLVESAHAPSRSRRAAVGPRSWRPAVRGPSSSAIATAAQPATANCSRELRRSHDGRRSRGWSARASSATAALVDGLELGDRRRRAACGPGRRPDLLVPLEGKRLSASNVSPMVLRYSR